MAKGRNPKIQTSNYQKFVLDCIEKGLTGSEIRRLLQDKGISVSVPTLNKYIKDVKREGINLSQFKSKTESAALAVNDKLKEIPELTSIFNRRNYLVENLLERRKKVLDYANEGKRAKLFSEKIGNIAKSIELIKTLIPYEDYKVIEAQIKDLDEFCAGNFAKDQIYTGLEDVIRRYTMDIHEICKYVEQWTSKYEIEALLEKLSELITKAAVNTFGPLLKAQNETYRQNYINKFVNEVQKAVDDVKQYEIELGDKNV